jgi:hypothetical protein
MTLIRSFRAKYFLGHLALSAGLVAGAAGLILVLWYPGALSRIDGVLPIVGLLVLVDVCLGPLLTLVVANPKKPRRELWRDLSVISAVQLTALVYGIYSAHSARPVFVVFDVKQFETVSAGELDYSGFESLPEAKRVSSSFFVGPQWVYAEPPDDPDERLRIMAETLRGGPEFKNLPRLFRPWPHDTTVVRAALRSTEELHGAEQAEVLNRIARLGVDPPAVGLVTLFGRSGQGIVALRRSDLQILFVVPRGASS